MAHDLIDATLARLCEGYNQLFAFHKKDAEEALRFHNLTLVDPELAGVEYARFEYDKAHRFLERFPFAPDLTGLRVMDLGCRNGGACVRYAVEGAARTVGVDIDPAFFPPGRALARELGVEDKVSFELSSDTELPIESGSIDVVLTEDVFEHLADPEAIFSELSRILVPGGRIFARFGPLWYHPHGVHLWEVFPGPWTHVLFPERVVVEVRHRHKQDGNHGHTYRDIGLNEMSVGRFRNLVDHSGFDLEHLHVSGIGGIDLLTRLPALGEFFSSEAETVLRKPQ